MAQGYLTPAMIAALLQGPALEAPTGETYNLTNPENPFSRWYVIVFTICFTFSTLSTFMRLYTRHFVIKKLGWEDYCCLLGWLMFIAHGVATGFAVHYGAGVHQWNERLGKAISVFLYTYISEILYGCIILALKTSILIQYRRIFPPVEKTHLMFWGTHLLNAVIFVYYIAITFVVAFQCHPVKKSWNPLIEGDCLSNQNIVVSAGYINTFTDFAILLLPQKIIWGLQMPLRKKVYVSAIFLVGLFASISSVIRLIYSYQFQHTGDFTFEIAYVGLWTFAEIASCFICACLPLLPRFIKSMKQTSVASTYVYWSRSRNRARPANSNTAIESSMGSQDSRKDGFIELEEQEVRDGSRSSERSLEEGQLQLQLPTVFISSDETMATPKKTNLTVWHGD